MASTIKDLGRVMPVAQGAYSATKAYVPLDIVSYNGGSYICLAANTGKAPTDMTCWQSLAMPGVAGQSVWYYSYDRGANRAGSYWSDLKPAPTVANPPKVGDTVVDLIGNVYQITNVAVTGYATQGGGTFDYGDLLTTIKGPKGDTGTVDNAGLTTAPAFANLQTQVNDSAVGTNLIVQSGLKAGYLSRDDGTVAVYSNADFYLDNYLATNGETVFTLSSPDYVFKGNGNDLLQMYDSNKKYLGYQNITSPTQTLSKSNVAYIRISINFVDEGGTSSNLSDWLANHRYKLEKGSVATDWCPNPSEILTKSDPVIIDHSDDPNQGRGIDCPPSYYQANYPAKEVSEFKQTANVGVTLVSGQTSTYGILSTRVPSTNTGFGRPRQVFEPTLSARPLTYTRIGISDTAWSDWELVTTW